MYTVEELANADFRLKVNGKYMLISKPKTGKGSFLTEATYLGESGVNNAYLMFKLKNGTIECFLKIDIIIGEYGIKELSKKERVAANAW